MDKVNRKAAPRRQVVGIEREGAWGRVEYAHLLDCGHTERRKRATRSKYLSCAWCVVAEQTDAELRQLSISPKQTQDSGDDLLDVVGSQLAMTERLVAQVRAEIASHHQVPVESVDVIVSDEDGEITLSFATIFIPATDIAPILRRLANNPLLDDTPSV